VCVCVWGGGDREMGGEALKKSLPHQDSPEENQHDRQSGRALRETRNEKAGV
jgi:hypothetical protein